MKKILLGIGLALLLIQCDKEDEKDDTSTTDKTSNVADCAPAVTEFADIQKAIDAPISPNSKGCATTDCHVAGATEPVFVKGSASQNRNKLAGYEGGYWKVGNRLYQKINENLADIDSENNNPSSHGGGNQSAILTNKAVTRWTTAEAGCN